MRPRHAQLELLRPPPRLGYATCTWLGGMSWAIVLRTHAGELDGAGLVTPGKMTHRATPDASVPELDVLSLQLGREVVVDA